MFNLSIDERLSSWSLHRAQLEICADPYTETWEFWKSAPFIPYNNKIDPHYQSSWPSPWEIIVENKYDDFTKTLMIGYSLSLTKRFNNSLIEVKTIIDKDRTSYYNIVVVDEDIVINYNDNGPDLVKSIPESFLAENIVQLRSPK